MPDLLMVIFYAWEVIRGVPEQIIWREHYFLPFWQGLFDTVNSIPLISVSLGIALYFRKTALGMFFASMLIHCFLDFPVHHDDGHRHFYPFSDFRFSSPLSYWDPQYYGNVVGVIEAILFTAGCFYLWRADKPGADGVGKLTTLRKVILATGVVYLGFFAFVINIWMDI